LGLNAVTMKSYLWSYLKREASSEFCHHPDILKYGGTYALVSMKSQNLLKFDFCKQLQIVNVSKRFLFIC